MLYIGFARGKRRHAAGTAATHSVPPPDSIAIGRRSQRKQRPIWPRFINRARE